MKVIVSGSRHIKKYKIVQDIIEKTILENEIHISLLLHGACRGVDQLAATWAVSRNIPVLPFPADWQTYGISAGPRRNAMMAKHADAAILLWDGRFDNCGTLNMLENCRDNGLPYFLHKVSI